MSAVLIHSMGLVGRVELLVVVPVIVIDLVEADRLRSASWNRVL